jgi:hypothetical protein
MLYCNIKAPTGLTLMTGLCGTDVYDTVPEETECSLQANIYILLLNTTSGSTQDAIKYK